MPRIVSVEPEGSKPHGENCFCDTCIMNRVEYLMEKHTEIEERKRQKIEMIKKVRWTN